MPKEDDFKVTTIRIFSRDMRPEKIVLIFQLYIATLAYSAAISQSDIRLGSRFRSTRTNAILPPQSRLSQDAGDFFDLFLSTRHGIIGERGLQRTKTLTEITWTEDSINFNISMSRCLTMSDKAGVYTSKLGIIYNATISDIAEDLQARNGNEAANRVAYASRVNENAQSTIDAANALLKIAVVDYQPITSIERNNHDEFRRLLAPLNEIAVIMVRASLLAEISVGFYAGVMGRIIEVVPDESILVFAIVSYGLHVARGIQKLAQRQQGTSFIASTIYNIFLSWFRDALRVFAGEYLPVGEPAFLPSVWSSGIESGSKNMNRTNGTLLNRTTWPISQEKINNASSMLGQIEEPHANFIAATGIRESISCR